MPVHLCTYRNSNTYKLLTAMKIRLSIKIFIGLIILVLMLFFIAKTLFEPWLIKKIEGTFNSRSENYLIQINKVHISTFASNIEIDKIEISPKQAIGDTSSLKGEITSISINRINIIKALLNKDIEIGSVKIGNCNLKGKKPFSSKKEKPIISGIQLKIGNLFLDKVNLAIESDSKSNTYSLKDGVLHIFDLFLEKNDTVDLNTIKNFDFAAKELVAVASDSVFTYQLSGIAYSNKPGNLRADSFSIHPNFNNYDFNARRKFETDRIEAVFNGIFFRGFSPIVYLNSGNLTCSYVEIDKMDMKAYRDKRKVFNHVRKPALQDMIYDYNGLVNIDSVAVMNGNITYTEQVKKADEPGMISFDQIKLRLYKITNDTAYKTEKAYSQLNAEALLMGKGKLSISLKSRIFDRSNAFSVNGSLSGMNAGDLNPMLGNNAFVYATSGKIDAMHFSFKANNFKADGSMVLRYHGLVLAVKNKQTNDTTGLKARVMSLFANIKVMDSNPNPNKEVRKGIIDYKRDPERFIINYCFKSILTGIKSSLTKKPEK